MKNDPNFDFYSFHFEVENKPAGPRLNQAETMPPLSSVTDEVVPVRVDKTRRRAARRAFSRVGWGFVLMIVLGLIACAACALSIQTFAPEWVGQDWYVVLVGSLPMYLIALLVFSLVLLGLPKRTPERARIGFGGFVAFFTAGIAMMTVGTLLGNGVMLGVSELLGHEYVNVIDQVGTARPWLLAVYLLLLAPLFEELIFRKLLIDRLLPHGEWGAVLVSALLFALFHGNLYQFFGAVLVGALLSFLYLRTGRVGLGILLHSLFNLFCGVVPLLLEQQLDLQLIQGATDPAVLLSYLNENVLPYCLLLAHQLFSWVLSFAGVIVFFVCRRKYFKTRPQLGELTGRRGTVVFLNVGMLLALIFSVAYFELSLIFSVLS